MLSLSHIFPLDCPVSDCQLCSVRFGLPAAHCICVFFVALGVHIQKCNKNKITKKAQKPKK